VLQEKELLAIISRYEKQSLPLVDA